MIARREGIRLSETGPDCSESKVLMPAYESEIADAALAGNKVNENCTPGASRIGPGRIELYRTSCLFHHRR